MDDPGVGGEVYVVVTRLLVEAANPEDAQRAAFDYLTQEAIERYAMPTGTVVGVEVLPSALPIGEGCNLDESERLIVAAGGLVHHGPN